MAETAATLTLSTARFKRSVIKIDDEKFLMRSPSEMSIAMMRRMEELQAIAQDEKKSNIEKIEALDEAIGFLMIDMPEDYRRNLPIDTQVELLSFFGRTPAKKKTKRKGSGATRS